MTKTELVQAIARDNCITQKSAAAVDDVLDVIGRTLQKGGEVRLPGFSLIVVKTRSSGRGADRIGQPIESPEYDVVAFRPDMMM